MALPSLSSIASHAKQKLGLFGVAVTHRLGRVPIGEESILIAVSAGHRREAWDAAEWILEEVKRKTEIWKRESYENPEQEPEWKANAPGIADHGIFLTRSAATDSDIWYVRLWKVDAVEKAI